MTTVQIRADAETVPSLAARARDVLGFEWTKLRSVRSNYVTLLIAAVATIGSTVIVAHALASTPALPPGGPITALTASFLGYAESAVLPVSVLTGARQTGKTTLSKSIEPSRAYFTLDEVGVLDQAERKLLVVVLGADIGHVERHVRQVARTLGLIPLQRLVGHLHEIAPESGAEGE